MRRGRRKKLKPRHLWYKRRQNATCAAPVAGPRAGLVAESRLFDRHGEPADQPRDLIQMLGIMLFNGLREPKQAFVVTHGGNVAWDDRRYRAVSGRSAMAGIESAPMKPGTTEPSGRLSRIGGPIHDTSV